MSKVPIGLLNYLGLLDIPKEKIETYLATRSESKWLNPPVNLCCDKDLRRGSRGLKITPLPPRLCRKDKKILEVRDKSGSRDIGFLRQRPERPTP